MRWHTQRCRSRPCEDLEAGRLPGPSTVYLGQNLRFGAPVRPGDTVHAKVTVREPMPERRRVTLTTVCTVAGKVVIDGDALVMPTSRQTRSASRSDLFTPQPLMVEGDTQ